ncbi:MAG: Hpt domain-containing protein [Planctomycetota bacterium]
MDSSQNEDGQGRNPDKKPPFDVEKALDQIGGDRETFYDVLDTFVAMIPVAFDDIIKAQRAQDLAALSAAAHSLKGAASAIAAEPTRVLAERLEFLEQENANAIIGALVVELESQLAGIKAYASEISSEE